MDALPISLILALVFVSQGMVQTFSPYLKVNDSQIVHYAKITSVGDLKLGDITVLSKDILTIPDDQILSTRVLYTIVGFLVVPAVIKSQMLKRLPALTPASLMPRGFRIPDSFGYLGSGGRPGRFTCGAALA